MQPGVSSQTETELPAEQKTAPARSSFLPRLVTAVLAASVTLGALFTTHAFPVFLLALVIAVLGFKELVKLAGIEDRPWAGLTIGLFCYVTPIVVAWLFPPQSPKFWVTWAVLWGAYIAGCFGVYQALRRKFSAPMSAAWLGAPIATALITHQETTMANGPFAANALLMLLVPVWIGDTAAMIVGKAFGKHLLAPSISPKKTWEGAIANLLACLLTSSLLGLYFKFPPLAFCLVGVFTGILGQLGDLAQSALKRSTGIKDSGSLLPGHGGVLDRVDSFLLSAVPSATALWLLVPDLFKHKLWP